MPLLRLLAACLLLALALPLQAGEPVDERFPLFAYVTSQPSPALVGYTPSQLDPRNPANQQALLTSSIRADLEALRPAFDGLVLYGYHEACTPRIVELARRLKYRAVLLAIWDPKSAAEIDGVAELARLHHKELALGVLVGNEGLTFQRYEAEDLSLAAERLRARLPKDVPLGTSEPLVGYRLAEVRQFGDFLAPNIHPVFDRQTFGPDAAAAWAREEALDLARSTGLPVILKETGFPHAGKAVYSPASQAAFWQAYLKGGRLATIQDKPTVWAFHGVAFEAFDLPWKAEASRLEIEKSWGLLSADRKPYPAYEVWQKLAPSR